MKANEAKVAAVGTLAPKSIFTYGGVNWIVLDSTDGGGALVLAKELIGFEPFNKDGCNDFSKCSLKSSLNGDFLEGLIKEGADADAFLPMTLDLTADDGLDDYGTDTAIIALISCEQYRKYRKIIPNVDDWWWTLTAFSTARNGYSYYVRSVGNSGALFSYLAYFGNSGVRPLCNLKSEILVSVVENADKPTEE